MIQYTQSSDELSKIFFPLFSADKIAQDVDFDNQEEGFSYLDYILKVKNEFVEKVKHSLESMFEEGV